MLEEGEMPPFSIRELRRNTESGRASILSITLDERLIYFCAASRRLCYACHASYSFTDIEISTSQLSAPSMLALFGVPHT